ncbi:hypothetical protein [Magnetospirillum sp. UT-4]|uniref:hypothetical protein n=1 Tax=Magnetospirillum sp. UT-4 TaxID=2681467 RepID=UPI00137F1900|nr:hypothetical protein [Magnetospirillum sp. UT-4]CAA7623935.1 exported hypothetical protein [Magnetospirillum sp. UT-4]
MKKAMLMGVSGAAMLIAASAQADGVIGQSQAFHAANSQDQYQGALASAEGGSASAPSKSHHYGMSNGSSASGADAYAKAKQGQDQDQDLSGSQSQYVKLPDIEVDVDVAMPGNGSGGAAGPSGDGGDGGNQVSGGEGNYTQSPRVSGGTDNAVATFRSRAAANVDGDAILGDNVNNNSFNVSMTNTTTQTGINTPGSISISTGNNAGGTATGGSNDLSQNGYATSMGGAGDATSTSGPVYGGDGGHGGLGVAVSANLGKQDASSYAKSSGGDGKAYSSAYGKSDADSYAKAGSAAASANLGKASNSSSAGGSGSSPSWGYKHGQSGSGSSAMGEAGLMQDAKAWANAFAKPTAKSTNEVGSAALGMGGAGGDQMTKADNGLDQAAHSMAAGGEGGAGGDTMVKSASRGGDLAQMTGLEQSLNGATGATSGGNGGNSSVQFSTGSIGAISLGTVSGITNVAQSTGIASTQLTSFSINAHTTF